ncbi:hypothetical protein KC19_1G174200 [Ceratodon purpureus]|uniref:Transmembrane protein n=1 Tax=Ceratodon purpureus TaxID=3225 RepID=A0A8T0J659_CERPU|nr:hypothetical protein KC19_1G174200 [Ceratodon purpureus]
MEEIREGIVWRMTVQAVPTLLSCLAFTSFSPLFFVGSIPFSLLFVTLSVLISVASWCWSPHEGVFSADENEAKYSSLYIDCSRVSSKLGNRSWWCCGEAPRGFQLAMLFLTWALLFLLLCMPSMANAEIGKAQADTDSLSSLGDGQEILEVTFKDLDVETASQSVDSGGPEKRNDDVTSGPVVENAQEEQNSEQSSFDSSVDSFQSEAHIPALDGKVELQSCRALVRSGQQVTCAAPDLFPALEADGASELCDCSKVSSEDRSSSCNSDGPVFPSLLEFGQQPLHQRQVAFLTIMNSCNGSKLSLLAAKSDNRQFFVTGFSEKFLAPGGTLKLPVYYLPAYVGAARGSIIIETRTEPLVVQLQGEGVASLYKMKVRVHEKSHYVISIFNPFKDTLFVEEAVVTPKRDDESSEERKRSPDLVSLSTLENEIVIEAQEECLKQDGNNSQNEDGLLMRVGETWELPGQTSGDILDFKICLNQGEVFRGLFHIRVTGPSLDSKGITLVYPFSSRVSRPSPVLSVPHTLDFGMLVGDQASSQPLVLQNSGEQLVQVEDVYEVPVDSKIKIDYKKGKILLPNSETEVANVTYSGQNQPYESSACKRSQKIIVRTNSTIGHLIEIPYRAMVLQCLQSPPAMAFGTGSLGTGGDLEGSHTGQLGITDLLMDYKVFMGLLICGLLVGTLVFFHVVVHDTELPTLSGDIGKGGGCHRRSMSRVSPLIKKRNKILKMWGWGALATVVDGIWTAFGSSLWTKDCNTPSPDYSLPRSVTPAPTPAPSATPLPKSSTGGSGASGPGSVQTGGRKGSADRKNSGSAKSEQSRNSKGNGEPSGGGSPVTPRDSNHHPSSVKQPKASKFLRPENTSAKHAVCVEDSVDVSRVVKDETVATAPVQEIEPIQVIAPAQSTGPIIDSSIKESPKNITSTYSCVPVAQKTGSPCAQPVEREKRKRRKKSSKHDVASHLGTSGGVSPASPTSPVAPFRSTWPVSPPSPDKKSDQSTASLSPRSMGSVDLAEAAPLPKLKVKILNSPKVTNRAPVTSATESPRRSIATPSQLQPRLQGKAAEHRRPSPLERGRGPSVSRKSNFSEWAAVARKKPSSTGSSKGSESGDGSHSYRASRHPHQKVGYDAFTGSEDGTVSAASFTTSASFPRLNSRPGESRASLCDFGIDSFDTFVVPPPAIAPALRAPGAKITKQAPTSEPSWSSLGITPSPDLHGGRIEDSSRDSWHASTSFSGQSSGELVYDIWGNHFGNLSQCSSSSEPSFQTGLEKEIDPVNSFHRLLVPEHVQQSEPLFPGTTGYVGDMSPTAAALYATRFKGFFSEGSTFGGLDDSRPASPASVHDLPDQLYPIDGAGSSEASKLGSVGGQTLMANHVKPRLRVPYSPPMGCVATTAFSTPAFSPLGTPTHALSSTSSGSKHSFWAHDNSSLPEKVVSPTLSLI